MSSLKCPLGSRGGLSSLLIATLLFVAACDQAEESSRAEPTAAADEFIAAWNDQDAAAMVGALDAGSKESWPAPRLRRLMKVAQRSGAIEDMAIERSGPVEEPPEAAFEEEGAAPVATVPYTIAYRSEAIPRSVSLEGELSLAYSREADAWAAEWDRELMWPGHEGAARFAIEYEWLRRGAILDRRGAKLAVGRSESRRYPRGAVGGITVGHIEPVSKKDLKDHGRAVHAGDLVGASGLEQGLDDVLAGEPRVLLSVVDRRGRPLEVLARRRGKPGRDVRTTLDVDVQRAAEAAYGSTTGGAIVMDPKTGDLLAVVSSSPFDPNNFAGVAGIEPFNRALSGLYPPGSSLKAMTGAAALESKVVKESTPLTGPQEYMGVRNFESGEFGTIDFATAVRFSVNTAFAQVAEDLGARRLTRFAEAFGFNRKPSMPLDAGSSSFPFPEDLGDLMWGSIGQAQVLATPLQMATIAATIANDGKRMEPRVELRGPKERERVVSRKTAAIMTRLMENVVQGGTGTAANIAGARVAGKTGTAEVDVNGQRMNHAWFICFAPANDPKVAVAVVSELGGVGGEVAAPLARGILSSVLPLVR
jgi:peptidoglycan glycosyltransferase